MSLSWWAAGPFVYLSLVIFIIATIYKIFHYSRMPRHLRWDLYPVPHQGQAGSKYQLVDYSGKSQSFSLRHELKAMLQEMVWIKKAFDNNRRLWYGSFPLHIGLYLSALWLIMLVLIAVLHMVKPSTAQEWLFLNVIIQSVGVLGLLLGLIGSVILLMLRLGDSGLRSMSDPVTYFNLLLLIVLFASGIVSWLTVDGSFDLIRQHIVSLLTFQPGLVHPLIAWQLFCFGVFLCILPFSRMMHYAAKYFFYHRILWDDEPVKAGGKLEQNIAGYLAYQVSWSADHLNKEKTWLEQVKQPEKGKPNE